MKLSGYTVKKSLLTKVTLKDAMGSYNTDENGAEVTMTFEGDIDTTKANEMANIKVRELLNWKDVGHDWLNQANPPEVLEKKI